MLAVALAGAIVACDKLSLTAPTESTINLFASGSTVPLNGSIELVANVIESSGTPVHNGTLVSFTTTLGRVEPAEARTSDGRATARLVSDGLSGTARVVAYSGPAVSEPLELTVGAAAAESLVLLATPTSFGSGGGTVQLTAIVSDADANPVAGVAVSFVANAGQLADTSVRTDDDGEARTQLTTSRTTEITARAGTHEDTATVRVAERPTVNVIVSPPSPIEDEPAVFTITVEPAAEGSPIQSVTIEYGDGQQQTLGTGSTTASHTYRATGTYTVTVRVRDTAGEETTQILVITVVPDPEDDDA